jgi:hypothetical protein
MAASPVLSAVYSRQTPHTNAFSQRYHPNNRHHHHHATKNQIHLCINIKSFDNTVTMVDIEDYKATQDITKKQRFEILKRRWSFIDRC